MKILKNITLITLFILIILMCVYGLFLEAAPKNFVNNPYMSYGVGWKNNKSLYAGSELNFIFTNSKNVAFGISTQSKADQGIEIYIDNKAYFLQSSKKASTMLSFNVDKNISHTVRVKHFCTYLYDPCEITLNQILLDSNVKFFPYRIHHKIFSILGDSISTIDSIHNYSEIVAQNMGYELHNASIMGSTVSRVAGPDNAILRYKKDLMSFKSDVILIFLGTNDVGASVNLDTFEKSYSEIVSNLKLYNANSRIFLAGILPRRDIPYSTIQQYNNVIEQIARITNTAYIDTSSWLTDESDLSDSIHPSLDGQRKLAENFTKVLASIPD